MVTLLPVAAPTIQHPRYVVGAPVGSGGQGRVVRVIDREAPALPLVAKVVGDPANARVLEGELRHLSRLAVPGLVRAHDFARDAVTGAPFLVEHYVEGPDARAWIHAAEPRVARERFVALVASLATTIAALHDAGVVHGDLKPEHVRIASGDRPVLLDLGAAVRRGLPAIAWTRAYAAPELLAGAGVGVRADLFGLGALLWGVATGAPPPRRRAPRADVVPWVNPRVAAAVDALLADHPEDRPADARAILASIDARGSLAAPTGSVEAHPDALRALLDAEGPAVRYLVGPSGVGKSHLLGRLQTAAALAGRASRRVTWPDDREPALVAFLRGDPAALPFLISAPERARGVLLVLDDLDRASEDLVRALEAYRCRHGEPTGDARSGRRDLVIVAARRTAPPADASSVRLGALSPAEIDAFCVDLGVSDPAERARLAHVSRGLPGWIVAHRGGLPASEEAILARAAALTPAARRAIGAIACVGGVVDPTLATRLGAGEEAVAELLAAGLVSRREDRIDVGSPALARELARALADHPIVDDAARVLLASPDAPAGALLSLAGSEAAPHAIVALHESARERAARAGMRAEETQALLWLAGNPACRTHAHLFRLERLVRDAGTARLHPAVLEWLDEAGDADLRVRSLARRRRAEVAVREGRFEDAEQLGAAAISAAIDAGLAADEAYARAQVGAIALYRGDWPRADACLSDARAILARVDDADAEELARMDHNGGVVALYRGREAEAASLFARSLDRKRALGDLAGTRSCLLNLGIARAKLGEHDAAERALAEAARLAVALSQKAGYGWCLAARADLELRRGNPAQAITWVREAEALGDALAAQVRADLVLVRADAEADLGSSRAALATLDGLAGDIAAADPFVACRALLVRAKAARAALPARPREAARLAIRAARLARERSLAEPERAAIALLRSVRTKQPRGFMEPIRAPAPPQEIVTHVLDRVAAGASHEEATLALLSTIVRLSSAERAFLVTRAPSGEVERAIGVDVDGVAIPSAEARVPTAIVRQAGAETTYVREADLGGGRRGSTLARAGAGGVVLVLEHRFVAGAFDGLSDASVALWVLLAGVIARLEERGSRAVPLASAVGDGASTSQSGTALHPRTEASIGFMPSSEAPMRASRRAFPEVVGLSSAIEKAKARLDAAVDSDLPVLILGETGTGKEVFARALHAYGPRARGPFVAVNSAAISDTLVAAEQFGHAKGACTGADRPRAGLLARAAGGTLLLDEVGELSPARQATLLRALETRRYRPVGADDERSFDVRVVAATNRELDHATSTFRRDLYFRLGVLTIHLPPLRARPEDVPVLFRDFASRKGKELVLSPRALARLLSYEWPGNVRELSHEVERLAASSLSEVDVGHLSRAIRAAPQKRDSRTDRERADVERALRKSEGNITHAAAALGLTRHGLKKRMLRLGLRGRVSGGSAS